MINVKDLMPGDVIFYTILKGRMAEHVGIYVGLIKDIPYMAHEVKGKYNCLMISKLPTDINLVAFRVTYPELAAQALRQILLWSEYKLPYDMKRSDLSMQFSDIKTHSPYLKMGIENQIRYASNCYQNRFYRVIKYAARRNLLPVNSYKNGPKRGMRCAQVVILAFQVSEIKDFVKTSSTLGVWISDKYACESLTSTFNPSDKFIKYQKQLRTCSEYPNIKQDKNYIDKTEQKFLPSIAAWRYDKAPSIETFFEEFRSVIPLDSKITAANTMMWYFKMNRNTWKELGKVDMLLPLENIKMNKPLWKNYLLFSSIKSTFLCSRQHKNLSKTSPKSLKNSENPISELKFKNSDHFSFLLDDQIKKENKKTKNKTDSKRFTLML